MTMTGMKKTSCLFTGELPFRQSERERWLVGESRFSALLGYFRRGPTADGERDLLVSPPSQKDVSGIAFEGDVEDLRSDRRSIAARAEAQRFRPNEEQRLVALPKAAAVSPRKEPERRLDERVTAACIRNLSGEHIVLAHERGDERRRRVVIDGS